MPPAPGPAAARGALAVAAGAIASLALSFTPFTRLLEDRLLDAQWHLLRVLTLKPAPDEIVIVGVDEETLRRLPQPRPLWHEPLGKALTRIAAAGPRAIGLDFPLPDRSYEQARPGLDEALALGL